MELDTLGDRKTALFLIMSDTDTTFNFVIAMLQSQLFNLLCDKADDEYGGRLPVHVRCILDEFANIGQIPNFDKLIATIRSREISASIILQSQSQLKTIYKDAADTIVGNCDTTLFLGGKEKSTLKELSEILGKETIDSFNTSENRGTQVSHGLNYQKLGKELMSQDEIAVMDGGKCILQVRGTRPFLSDKFDITAHMPAVSVGAFVDKTLVAFILNGVREWDNEKTVYDLGTGVIPDFRRTGIMGELLNLVSAICIKNKIRVYQLEVIQDNEKALTLYKKQGFQVDRVLNCYQLTGGIKEPGIYKAWKLEHPEKIQEAQWTIVKDFWTYPPSWQNAKDAVCAIARSFSYTIVKFDGNLIGYGIVDKIKGDIVQLAVHPQYRRMGVATEILLDLSKQTKSLEMKVINVDERDQALNIFLKKMKFRVFVKQYEMRKYFSV